MKKLLKKFDQKWVATPGEADFMEPYLEGEGAKHLRKVKRENEGCEELIIIERQGGTVASIEKEEQFWCGEFPGFQKALRGDVFVGDIEFDESEQEYLVHIYIPVKDGDSVIGVLDIGFEPED